LASIGLIAILLIPAFFAIAAIPDTVIAAVYGNQWTQVAVLLTPLALAMPVNAILAVGGPLMSGLGAAGRDAAAQAVCVVVLSITVWFAAQISLAYVAWVILGVYILRAFLVTYLALGLVSGEWMQVFNALVGPILLGCIAALIAWVVDVTMLSVVFNSMLRLCLDISIVATVLIFVLLKFGQHFLSSESISVAGSIATRLPLPLSASIKSWGSVP
jgi:PST family polysaccharide transporter